MKLIAEIKKRSPFEGLLKEQVNPAELAAEYTRLGAGAISVVTAAMFDGELNWIKEVREATHLPILRKDFIHDVDQLEQTRDLGADWILLIADFLTLAELDDLCFHANHLGLKPVVEVHSLASVRNAQIVDTNRIMINNRELRTGKVNVMHALNLLPMIDTKYEITVASGLDQQPQLLKVLNGSEVDFVLIGKALMTSTNLEQMFQEILTLCERQT